MLSSSVVALPALPLGISISAAAAAVSTGASSISSFDVLQPAIVFILAIYVDPLIKRGMRLSCDRGG